MCQCPLFDNDIRLEGRCVSLGWAFVVYNSAGEVVASAHGVPPSWIDTIYGAELWALQMVVSIVIPDLVKIYTDCKSVQQGCSKSPQWAASSRRLYARAWMVINTTFADGNDVAPVVWMPAHTAEADVGALLKSDGTVLSNMDRDANALADKLAKLAAQGARYAAGLRKRIR